ncbi:MAG: hypothetical protein ACRDQ1_16160 [Sciscionella sp.]
MPVATISAIRWSIPLKIVWNPAATRGSKMASAVAGEGAQSHGGLGHCGAALADPAADVAQVLLDEGVRRGADHPRLGATGVGSLREGGGSARQPLQRIDDELGVHRGRGRLEADQQVVLGP